MGPLAISRLSRMREAQFRRTVSTTFRIILVVGRFRVSRFLHNSKMADLFYLLKEDLRVWPPLNINLVQFFRTSQERTDMFLLEKYLLSFPCHSLDWVTANRGELLRKFMHLCRATFIPSTQPSALGKGLQC